MYNDSDDDYRTGCRNSGTIPKDQPSTKDIILLNIKFLLSFV